MKKNLTFESGSFQAVKKALFFMKLTFVLVMAGILQVSAKVNGQAKVSLKLNSIEIKKALKAIENQADYRFLYNNNLKSISQKVNIDVSGAGIKEVLDKMFAGTDLAYKILDNNLIVVLSNTLVLQDIKVTGKITGENGEALSGVSVSLKGTSIGTTTDNNGNFTLTVPEKGTLTISYIGYQTQELKINSQPVINISLSPSKKALDEVVVIGYGTASKRDLTGSIVKIAGKEVSDRPNVNPIASLQGKVSGVSIVNSGVLGNEPDIRIRGTVSKTQTKPLYVVDGILNDNIDFLNPSDIESIEVLKDPSSLAIFGVRGANGVIVVTSKKGKAGALSVNFNANVGIKKFVDKIKLTDASGFKTLFSEQLANEGAPPFDYSLYNANTDWQNVISQSALINRNNVSISSGSEKNKFYMGIGYQNDQGIIKHERLQKFSISLSDELKVSKAIKIGFNVDAYKGINPQNHDFSNALAATPIIEPFNTAHSLYNQMPIGSAQIGNPLRSVEETQGQYLSNTYRVVGSVFAEIAFLKKFTFKTTYYTDLAFNDSRTYAPLVSTFNVASNSVAIENSKTSITQDKSRFSKFQQDYLLTYKSQFGDHGLTVLGGFSTNFNDYSEVNVKGSQFSTGLGLPIPNDKRQWYLDNRVFVDPNSIVIVAPGKDEFGNFLPYQWEQATVSFLARMLYNYKGKYMLNASFRRDGSSDIANSNRYQNFEAIGAAWEISKETFMQNQNLFDFLKLKASWGILGNQYTAIHYPFYPILSAPTSAVFGPGSNGTPIPGYTPSFIPDPNLHWETIHSTEIGLEYALSNNKLSGDINYFHKLTKDLLTGYPAGNGQKPGITNAGEISNKGFEISLIWRDKISKDLTYSISGNFTTLNNKVTRLYQNAPIYDGPTRTRVGDPIGSFFGYVVTGVVQNSGDSAKIPQFSTPLQVGELKYQDVNNSGSLTDSDRVVIGNPTPKFIYGISIGLNFKGFDFMADFQGVSGNQIYRAWGNGAGYATLNYRAARLGRWHGEGTSNSEPRMYQKDPLQSTYMIESGSYFRIRNIQLGYNFNASSLSKMNFKSFRVFVSAQNLKTFKHNSGYTPEFGGSATQFGVDNGSYPIPAIYTFGINANF